MSLSYMLNYAQWWLHTAPLWQMLLYLVVVNLLTYAAYAYDKRAAVERRWRTPEAHLHMLSLLGGSPAAYYAQRTLRHKNRKASFQRLYWMGVVLQVVVILAVLLG